MFWLILGVMLVAAVLVVVVPLYRSEGKVTANAVLAIFAVAAISGGLYTSIGTPNSNTDASAMPSVDEMVAALAARLEENPNDVNGWKMLGRSYFQLRNFAGAAAAFERAVELEDAENGQTLADLGEAIVMQDARMLNGRAGDLFENALALVPNNPKALFYSGMAAIERGDNELGADRWEALLATSPPPNVQDILRQRIVELRGGGPVAEAPAADGPVVMVNVALGAGADAAVLPEQTVFIIARDPDQPSPPLAAVRRRVSELPAAVPIGDSDAMIPGRVPSGFERLEILARVSSTGQPVAQPGDWYGQQIVAPADSGAVNITIDRQVP